MNKPLASVVVGVLLACACVTGASAQYSWMDKDGRKVYSDHPPPSGINEKNVLKRPNPAVRQSAVAPSNATSSSQTAGGRKPDSAQELAAKMKEADDADAARKQAEADRVARVKSDNCLRAQQAHATYASGVPLSHINAQGERELLADAARNAETQRLNGIIASDCR